MGCGWHAAAEDYSAAPLSDDGGWASAGGAGLAGGVLVVGTLGARIGRIAPDNGRCVGMAGCRGSGCTVGRAEGGAANSDGVTGSVFGAADTVGPTGAATAGATGGVVIAGCGAGAGCGARTAADGSTGVEGIGAGVAGGAADVPGCSGVCTGIGARVAAVGCGFATAAGCNGGATGPDVSGLCSGVVNSGAVVGALSRDGAPEGAAGAVVAGDVSAARDGSGARFTGGAIGAATEAAWLRSASSSSISRGAPGALPFCAVALACLRRRPPRRPRRRLPVPADASSAGAAFGAVLVSAAPAGTPAGFAAMGSAAGADTGVAAAGRCVSCRGVAGSLRAGLVSWACVSPAGFTAADAAGFWPWRGWRCESSARDLFGLACEPFDGCWPCWRPRRASPSRSRSWPLRRAPLWLDASPRRSDVRSRRAVLSLRGGVRGACVSSASVGSAAGGARNQPNRRPSKPPDAAAGAAAAIGAETGSTSSRCGIGVARWMPLTAGSSPCTTTPMRGCGVAATSVRRS